MILPSSQTHLTPDGALLTCWHLPGCFLEARWQQPLQLLEVRLLPAGSGRADLATPIDVPMRELQTLTWLSCEKVSHALTLDDPLQAELALGIMQARMACLDDIRWQDERPSGGENVSRLPGRHHNMR